MAGSNPAIELQVRLAKERAEEQAKSFAKTMRSAMTQSLVAVEGLKVGMRAVADAAGALGELMTNSAQLMMTMDSIHEGTERLGSALGDAVNQSESFQKAMRFVQDQVQRLTQYFASKEGKQAVQDFFHAGVTGAAVLIEAVGKSVQHMAKIPKALGYIEYATNFYINQVTGKKYQTSVFNDLADGAEKAGKEIASLGAKLGEMNDSQLPQLKVKIKQSAEESMKAVEGMVLLWIKKVSSSGSVAGQAAIEDMMRRLKDAIYGSGGPSALAAEAAKIGRTFGIQIDQMLPKEQAEMLKRLYEQLRSNLANIQQAIKNDQDSHVDAYLASLQRRNDGSIVLNDAHIAAMEQHRQEQELREQQVRDSLARFSDNFASSIGSMVGSIAAGESASASMGRFVAGILSMLGQQLIALGTASLLGATIGTVAPWLAAITGGPVAAGPAIAAIAAGTAMVGGAAFISGISGGSSGAVSGTTSRGDAFAGRFTPPRRPVPLSYSAEEIERGSTRTPRYSSKVVNVNFSSGFIVGSEKRLAREIKSVLAQAGA